MTYALSRIVTIWMSLYYNLPRIKLRSRETDTVFSVEKAIDYLAELPRRSEESPHFFKMRAMFNKLSEFDCKNSLNLIKTCWQSALTSSSIPFKEPIDAISLIDFPRFHGALWPHNDIAVYFPQLKKTAVMKIADRRFHLLREKLMNITHGVDPFIGTSFTIEHSKLHPIFNRVKCSRALPISPKSFKKLGSFSEQLNILVQSYVAPDSLRSLIQGDTILDLKDCIIARYGSGYALMQFITSQAKLVYAQRHNDYNYSLMLDIDGLQILGYMFRDCFFDPAANPSKYENKTIRFAGFVLVGFTALEDYRARIHVISLALGENMPYPAKPNTLPIGALSIKNVEDELIELTKLIKLKREEDLKEEKLLEEEVFTQEDHHSLPQIRTINDSELTAEQGRILAIVYSDKTRGFRFEEIRKRLDYEQISLSHESIMECLNNLCNQELLYLNIFGDLWYANSQVRLAKTVTKISPLMIEPQIVEHLKSVYPKKIPRGEIVSDFCKLDSRVNALIVVKALNNLTASRKIIPKKNRYSWNPYPPAVTPTRKESINYDMRKSTLSQDETLGGFRSIILNEQDLISMIDLLLPQVGQTINLYGANGLVKKYLMYNLENSISKIQEFIADIRKGRYQSCHYKDISGGNVLISIDGNTIKGTYTNTNYKISQIFPGRK